MKKSLKKISDIQTMDVLDKQEQNHLKGGIVVDEIIDGV